jgi:hypothetical protein
MSPLMMGENGLRNYLITTNGSRKCWKGSNAGMTVW